MPSSSTKESILQSTCNIFGEITHECYINKHINEYIYIYIYIYILSVVREIEGSFPPPLFTPVQCRGTYSTKKTQKCHDNVTVTLQHNHTLTRTFSLSL